MRGEITFDDSLRLRVKMLRNLNIDECKKHIIPKIHVTKGANVLIDALHDAILLADTEADMSLSAVETEEYEEIISDYQEALKWVESLESYNPERLH